MTKPIILGNYLTMQNSASVIRICKKIAESIKDISIDASLLKFADPFGIATLGASFYQANQRGVKINVQNLKRELAGYLSRMDLFDGVELSCELPCNNRNDCQTSLVELRKLDSPKDVDSSAFDIAKALIGHTGLDPNEPFDEMTCVNQFDSAVKNLQYMFTELLDNSLTHARRNGSDHAMVWIASQYYPSKGKLVIGIIDNGCGFLGSLRNHEKLVVKTHEAAMKLAIQPYISCNRDLNIMTDSANQGVGLTTTKKLIADINGNMTIISGNACLTNDKSSILSDNNYWRGVAIGIECHRDKLTKVNFESALPPRRNTNNCARARFT